jgi:hypothetical protein
MFAGMSAAMSSECECSVCRERRERQLRRGCTNPSDGVEVQKTRSSGRLGVIGFVIQQILQFWPPYSVEREISSTEADGSKRKSQSCSHEDEPGEG